MFVSIFYYQIKYFYKHYASCHISSVWFTLGWILFVCCQSRKKRKESIIFTGIHTLIRTHDSVLMTPYPYSWPGTRTHTHTLNFVFHLMRVANTHQDPVCRILWTPHSEHHCPWPSDRELSKLRRFGESFVNMNIFYGKNLWKWALSRLYHDFNCLTSWMIYTFIL